MNNENYQVKKGITYIIMAGFFFALMTFFVRKSGDLPSLQKAFFRNFIAALIAVFMILKQGGGFVPQKGNAKYIFFRCLFGTSGLICNFIAIDHLRLADANITNKLSPFFAIIASYFILKEKAKIVDWLCVIGAFCGAVFVVKPSMSMDFAYGMIGVYGGFGAGVAYSFVRKLGFRGEKSAVIVFFFSMFSCLVTLPYLIFKGEPMEWWQLGFLILAGICAAGGQFCITTAYTKAPAKEISVFDYTQILFAAMLGVFFLSETPDVFSVIGYVIIIGCAIYKWWYHKHTTTSREIANEQNNNN